jgi:hypothetical protein
VCTIFHVYIEQSLSLWHYLTRSSQSRHLVGGAPGVLIPPLAELLSWVPKPNLLHGVASEPEKPFFYIYIYLYIYVGHSSLTLLQLVCSWFENKFYVAVTFHVRVIHRDLMLYCQFIHVLTKEYSQGWFTSEYCRNMHFPLPLYLFHALCHVYWYNWISQNTNLAGIVSTLSSYVDQLIWIMATCFS